MIALIRFCLGLAVFVCLLCHASAQTVMRAPDHEAISAELRKLQAVPIRVPAVAAEDDLRTQQIAALRALYERATKGKDRTLAGEIAAELRRLGVILPYEESLQPKALVHPTTHVVYYLESDGRTVSAISPEGKILWHRDPLRDAGVGPYRYAKPVINGFIFADKTPEPKALSIGYNSSQFGLLDLATGDFRFQGQN
ncbi:MAG TPA: hypothetical protein VGO11_15925 [Chthoniobacteraceae bacterium]|jgi:hypothetical protein|nr:hypothetical protein [Chthoniobacteraceae bacterium]